MDIGKLPPHNIDAEESVISACISGYIQEELFSIIQPNDFYRSSHQSIFSSIRNLFFNKKPVDLITISEHLKSSGLLDKVGGTSSLLSFIENIPVSTNPIHHAKIIKSASSARQLFNLAYQIADSACTATQDSLPEIIESAQSKISDICALQGMPKKRINIDNVYTADRMIQNYESYIKTLKNNRFLTGIDEIDKRIRGVSGGEVLTIIARAGSFKTAMLQNMLLRYTNSSAWASVFFSLEMPVSSVTERYLAITMGFEGREVENTFLDNLKDGKQQAYIDEIRIDFSRRMDRIFVVPVKVSLTDCKEYVRLIEKEHKIKVGVIGIDYMGLLDCNGKNEYETISVVARETKEVAKELNIPVVVLSQVSRKGGDGEEEISLDMGRGSGAIEEGADFVLGLWQHENKDHTGKPTGAYDLVCRILKNRKGSKGSRWKLSLTPETLRFGETAVEFVPEKQKKTKKNL